MKIADLFGERDFQEYQDLEVELTEEELKEIKSRTETYTKNYICSVIRFIGKQPIEFAIASHFNKKNEFEWQCVMKLFPGWSYCFMKNMYLASMGGWIVVWNTKQNRWSYYWNNGDFNKWFISSKPNYALDCINYKDLKKNEYYQFSDIRFGVSYYMTIYEKFKSLEILNKLDVTKLATNYKFMELLENNKTFKKFFIALYKQIKWDSDGAKYTAEYFLWCWNRNINDVEEADTRRALELSIREKALEINRYVSNNFCQRFKLNPVKLYEYGYHCNYGFYSYMDYLKACEYLQLNFKDTKVLYPKEFKHWHDYYIAQMDAIKDARTDECMNTFAKANKALEMKFKGYYFILPNNTQDLIDEGEALNHCVGRMGYNKKVGDGESFIVFARTEKSTPEYTLEITQEDIRIKQFYGKDDTVPPVEVRDIVNKWFDKIKNLIIPMDQALVKIEGNIESNEN